MLSRCLYFLVTVDKSTHQNKYYLIPRVAINSKPYTIKRDRIIDHDIEQEINS